MTRLGATSPAGDPEDDVVQYQTLIVERRGPVGWIVFNRPERGNAMDAVMLDELEHAWRELDGDPEVRVIVNTGTGSSFQTGVDVAQMSKDKDALRKQSRRTRDAELRRFEWRHGQIEPVDGRVCLVTKLDDEHPIDDVERRYVLTARVARRSREPGFHAVCRRGATVQEPIGHARLRERRHVDAFRDLRADGVVLVRGNCDRGQDADDRHDDHQLDQREARLAPVLCHRLVHARCTAGASPRAPKLCVPSATI